MGIEAKPTSYYYDCATLVLSIITKLVYTHPAIIALMNDLRTPSVVLTKYIKDRINWVIFDVNSFIYIVRPKKHTGIKKISVGGGNLLAVLGLFSALNYLGKIYFLLRNDLPYTAEEILKAKKWIKNNVPTEMTEVIKTKRGGELNELECFIDLMKDCPCSINLKEDDLAKIWRSFRNKLSHVVDTQKYSASLVYDFTGKRSSEIEKLIKNSKDKPFIVSGRILICMTDVLNNTVQSICDWLCEGVSNKFSEVEIKRTLNWLEKYG